MKIIRPNPARQRTRPSRSGCHRTPSRAGSLSLGRQAASIMPPRIFFIIFAAILFFGCERAPSPKDVVGTYSGSLNGVTETLVLRADGTFSQNLTLPSGQKTNSSGSWSLEYKAVTFDRYLKFYDGEKNGAFAEPTQVYGSIYRWGASMLIRDWGSSYYTLKK